MISSYRPSATFIRVSRILFLVLVALLYGQSLRASDGPCLYIDDYNFGVLSPGQVITRSVQICNLGTGYITFTNPTGGDVITWLENDFSISDADMTMLKNTVLGPGTGTLDPNAPSCVTIKVTFAPTRTGLFHTTARIWADTRNCRDTSIWTATATQPGPQITSYDWKEKWVTTLNSCTKNTLGQYEALIYVSNAGTSPYKVQSLEIVGTDNAYFKFDNSDSVTTVSPEMQIKPGDANKRAQKVIFTPHAERNYLARIRLVIDNGDIVESLLQGTGIESHISLTGEDFGTVEFKGTESTKVDGKVDLTTKPTRPTTITDIRITGPDAADFRFDWANATGPYTALPTLNPGMWANIPINTSIHIPIDFTPTSPGSKTAMLEVIGDFSECDTSIIPLTGNAVTSLSVSGDAVDQVMLSADDVGTFTLSLPHAAAVTLDLHDASGNRVAQVANGMMEAGAHRITIENEAMASGVYLYRFSADGEIRTGRIVVVR
jgi:hypothetical protein